MDEDHLENIFHSEFLSSCFITHMICEKNLQLLVYYVTGDLHNYLNPQKGITDYYCFNKEHNLSWAHMATDSPSCYTSLNSI